jgi:hypothetical protein
MKIGVLAAVLLAAGPCAPPQPMSASVNVIASSAVRVGELSQLVVKVTNTGPVIPHLGLVFRTSDHWYDRHEMKNLSGCVVAAESSGFDCGDLAVSDSRTFSFSGVALAAGTFHYELALRELVQPYDWVNDHPDGADAQAWDEAVS